MRIKINLSSEHNVSLPIEYSYNIYLNLRKSVMDFVQSNKPKLYNKYKKEFPCFTFSQLMIPERKIDSGFIHIYGNYLSLLVSSADDTFMEYLIKSINQQKEFKIFQESFKLKKIQVMEEPDFEGEMYFKMLSPLLLATMANGKPYFMRAEDANLSDVFSKRLVKDYNTYYKQDFKPEQIRLIPDQAYIERSKTTSKLITIRNIHYRAIFCPITLKGEIDLIRFAYRNGIGDKTQFGFGMIEAVEPTSFTDKI